MTPSRACWRATSLAPHRRLKRPEDTGSATVFVVALAVGLLMLVGLVADGGAKVRAIRRADVLAAEAARAGGQAVDLSTVIAGQRPVVDPAAARQAARAYLNANDVTGTVAVADGGRRISVDVTLTRPTVLLGLVGIDTVTVHGHSSASLVRGLREVIP